MRNTILVFFCLFFSVSLFSQSLKQLKVKEVPCDEFFSYEKRNNAHEGVLILSTTVRNLSFKVYESYYEIDKIDSTSINGYILTIKYDPEIANRKFNLIISGKKYKEYSLRTDLRQCYVLKASSISTFDWNKDFNVAMGVGSGIVTGEFGFYGEMRFWKKTGFAFVGGYSPGFSENDERWSVGIKGYHNHWFLSTLYGTTLSFMNKNKEFTMNDDGTFILKGSRTKYREGITLLSGYDRTIIGWLYLTVGIGVTITPTVNPKFLPVWNVGVGFSFVDYLNR